MMMLHRPIVTFSTWRCAAFISQSPFIRLILYFLFPACVVSPTLAEKLLLCESYCSCLGSFVDCSGQQLQKIPDNFPLWIEVLKLNKNAFIEMPSFPRSLNLTSLNLAHNKISTINKDILANVPNLKILELNNNWISELPAEIFANVTRLEVLNFNSNHISRIEPGAFDGLTNLRELKLNRNKLTTLSKELFRQLNSLQILELNRNKITQISGLCFQELEHLLVLRLRQNDIEDLADGAFYGLYNLHELCLDYNQLTFISKGWLYGLELLNHLNVSYNKIQYLNKGWESCPHLTELDISNNNLQSIEKTTFEHLSKLQLLKLDNNHISYIEEGVFSFVPSLQSLDLSNNYVSWIVENQGEVFTSLKKLMHLSLAGNRISLLIKNAFVGLDSLTQLDLDGNEISEVENNPFEPLPHLKNLILNTSSLICNCHLSWLPTWLSSKLFYIKQDDIKCSYPPSLKKKLVYQLPPAEFVCTGNDYPQPRIVVHPEDVIALVGNNVTLRCGANASMESDMSFIWKRDNHRLENALIKRYASAQSDGVTQFSDLQLIDIAMSSSGSYQCSVYNNYGVAYSKTSQLSVLVFPSFTKVPINAVVKVGSMAKLDCSATGYPSPRISWQKDGGLDIPAAQERRMKIEDSFLIVNVKSIDVGVYTCTARNTAGMITSNATLTVLEAPSFSKKVEDKEVVLGEAAILECMASGFPKPKISWEKNGKPIQISKRHFLTAQDQLLVITDVSENDAGFYRCNIVNDLGSEDGVLELRIIPVRKGEFRYKGTVAIIVITIAMCIIGTSIIWLLIIWNSRKRKKAQQTSLSSVDNKLEESSDISKDSGTGDSTKRSYQDLLLTVATVNNSIEVIHEERSEVDSPILESTLPLLTTFQPVTIDNNSSTLTKDNNTASSSRVKYIHSANGTPLHIHPSKVEHSLNLNATCSSPSSSNGAQCACLTGTFKKSKMCDCVVNSSPLKHACYGASHCPTAAHNDGGHHENAYFNDASKRPCSIPAPCHHTNHCCGRHPNSSFLCLYVPSQHNMQS